MGISVFDVARYFLNKDIPNSERAITHLKLQKLAYYAQAWHLALLGDTLFDETIEAWVHGPVCPMLYYKYREYGFNEIPHNEETVYIPEKSRKVIDAVWEVYGGFDGRYLEHLTHKEEPWKFARGDLDDFDQSNNIIHTDSMLKYYKIKLTGDK